jgi:hypothetical protein
MYEPLNKFSSYKLQPLRCFMLIIQQRNNLYSSVTPEPECSSPHSQQFAISPYPEPIVSTPHPQSISPRSTLIPSSHLCLGLPSCLFPSGFSTKTLYVLLSSPMRATFPDHLVPLDLICPTIFGD